MSGVQRTSLSGVLLGALEATRGSSNTTATEKQRQGAASPGTSRQAPPGFGIKDAWDERPARPGTMGAAQAVGATAKRQQGLNIDWDFIGQAEGVGKLDGYVPNPKGSKSGVTIGTGVDLGARNMGDLNRLGLPDSLKEKLAPYLGKKKQEAVAFLKEHPLRLTQNEAALLDRAVKQQSLDSLVKTYNAAVAAKNATDKSKRRLPFEQLPREMQTVLASVHFQYGSLQATPGFFKQVVDQRWSDAKANLLNFGDAYPSRRKREAALLDRAPLNIEGGLSASPR